MEIRSGALKAETLFLPKRPLSPPQKKFAPAAKSLSTCSLKKTKDEISKQNFRQRVRIIENLEYVFFKILTLVPTDFL